MNPVVFKRKIQKLTRLLSERGESCDLFFFHLGDYKITISFIYIEGKGGTLFCESQGKKSPLFSSLEDGSGFYNIGKYKSLEKSLIKVEKEKGYISTIIDSL